MQVKQTPREDTLAHIVCVANDGKEIEKSWSDSSTYVPVVPYFIIVGTLTMVQ